MHVYSIIVINIPIATCRILFFHCEATEISEIHQSALIKPYGSVSKPIVPLLFTSKSLGFMDVHPTKNGIFIGIDPYPYKT